MLLEALEVLLEALELDALLVEAPPAPVSEEEVPLPLLLLLDVGLALVSPQATTVSGSSAPRSQRAEGPSPRRSSR